MNVEYPDSKTPIENIFWKSGRAPNGKYNVYLMYYRKHESNIDETPYSIKLKYGTKSESYNGVIRMNDKVVHIASFTLGALDNERNNNESSKEVKRNQLEQERRRLQEELERVNNEIRRLRNSN